MKDQGGPDLKGLPYPADLVQCSPRQIQRLKHRFDLEEAMAGKGIAT